MSKECSIGGQAVIEGVMMRGEKGTAVAVRKFDGEIATDFEEKLPLMKRNKFFSIPVIRGFITLIDSLITGIKTLNYSASFFEDEEEQEYSKLERILLNTFKEKTDDVIAGITLVFSLAFSILLFFVLPTFAADVFKKYDFSNTIMLNIIEGCIRVAIFIFYIFSIGKMKDIKRVFQYHGAEHKTIFCYENSEELTPENAQKYSCLHPRCGTNFLFLVMIVSILLFSLTGWNSIGERILYRIILLPIVSGLTYEIIKWIGKSNNSVSKIFAYPGTMLQKLTTREPDLSQLEVAIQALKVAEGLEVVNVKES